MTVRRSAAGVVAALLLLAGCGETEQAERQARDAAEKAGQEASKGVDRAQEELDKVDWDKYGTDAKRRLDGLADKADCTGLTRELAKAEGNDTALTTYIKERIRQANC